MAVTRRTADRELVERAAVHAALGDPVRLAIVDELAFSDRSPGELVDRLGVPSNLLAHHLAVLEDAGLVVRSVSAGDARRRYVSLDRSRPDILTVLRPPHGRSLRPMLFLCTHNSARSQLAAALWTQRTGRVARSGGTRPAPAVHPGAVRAARRAGLDIAGAAPRHHQRVPARAQVVTVCDLVHEDLTPGTDWWHWSIPDPVAVGSDAAFDAVLRLLDERIAGVLPTHPTSSTEAN